MPNTAQSPAEIAAQASLTQIRAALEEKKHFLLEAGAGAGKTYSLVDSLQFVIEKRGAELIRKNQRVACITYTNNATNEIITRTRAHPAIQASTIHSFCWSLVKDFQTKIRFELPSLPNWAERIAESDGLGQKPIFYDLGYPKIEDGKVWLHHNDVIALAARLLQFPKFRKLVADRFPLVFIDEYQDTEEQFAESLKTHLLGPNASPFLGFFGDHWQKIYDSGCGKIDHPNLIVIGKEANFRSVPAVVDCLNRMRPALPQQVSHPEAHGSVKIFHTNNSNAPRQTGQHWGGDLHADAAHQVLEHLRQQLAEQGWDFDPKITKILMLTHNVLASEQGYRTLAGALNGSEAYIKREDKYMEFFIDYLEPICAAFSEKKYGEMFALLGSRTPGIRSHKEKAKLSTDLQALIQIRLNGTIGDVVDLLKSTRMPRLSDSMERREKLLEMAEADLPEDDRERAKKLRTLRAIPYKEVIAVRQFILEKTPFATKHGVKGLEFENVLVVVGRGWNKYNFGQFLEWAGPAGYPADRKENFERNRNLFYVCCSRAKRRLAILFTQKLSESALATLAGWFGQENIAAAAPR